MAEKEKPEAEVKEPKAEENEEPKTPTDEEIEELRSTLSESQEAYKNLQRVVSKKDEDIQSYKDNQDLWKAMITSLAEQRGISAEEAEADLKQRKPNLVQQFDQKMAELDQRRFAEKAQSYKETAEGELGLKAGDEDYEVIESLVRTGKWDKADKKIEAIRAKKTQGTPGKKETEDEKVEKRLKKELEDRGLLTPEGGIPSSSPPKGFAKVEQDYIDGKISYKEYNKARKEEGI